MLFLKLLFVADKDSIALTLGKRLAHKSIAKDLQTWLDANSTRHEREGLAEIENHIDPVSFSNVFEDRKVILGLHYEPVCHLLIASTRLDSPVASYFFSIFFVQTDFIAFNNYKTNISIFTGEY